MLRPMFVRFIGVALLSLALVACESSTEGRGSPPAAPVAVTTSGSPAAASPTTTRTLLNVIGNMNQGTDGLRVDYRADVRRPGGGRVVSYTVDWGDGEQTNERLARPCPSGGELRDQFVVSHAYAREGLFPVVLTVTTGDCGVPTERVVDTRESILGAQPGSAG